MDMGTDIEAKVRYIPVILRDEAKDKSDWFALLLLPGGNCIPQISSPCLGAFIFSYKDGSMELKRDEINLAACHWRVPSCLLGG